MASLEAFMNKFGPKNQHYGSEVHELDHQPSPKAGGLDSFINRFTGFTESYFFYNNTVELRYNDESHTYWLVEELGNLTEQNGVTRTVHIINAAEMLVPWAAKMTVAKILRLIPTETIDGMLRIKPITFEEFTTIAMEAKSAHKDKLEEAGDIGGLAHKCLEDSITFAIKNDPEKSVKQLINLPNDDRAVNAANAGKNWMDQHRVKWVETETKIYSREHKYAGTMDGLAYVSSCNDKACCPEPFENRLSLIDWKSSNYLKIEYLFQTASYKGAKVEEFPELNIEDIWILRLGKNEDEAGKFEPWHMGPEDYDVCHQGFLACLALTRLVQTVTERMKEQKKLTRQRRKEIREAEKALKKEQEKLEKALKKAADKKAREEEKARIKAEAKAKREAEKAERVAERKGKKKPSKDAVVVADVNLEEACTSISNLNPDSGPLDSTPLLTKLNESVDMTVGIPNPTLTTKTKLQPESTISTEETNGSKILPQQDRTEPQPTSNNDCSEKAQADSGSHRSVEPSVSAVRSVKVLTEEPEFEYQTISLPGEK